MLKVLVDLSYFPKTKFLLIHVTTIRKEKVLNSQVSQPFERTAASPHALYLSVDGAAVLFLLVAPVLCGSNCI